MKFQRNLWIAIPLAILIALLAGAFWTSGAMHQLDFLEQNANEGNLVDLRPWQMASAIAPLAYSVEEQNLAHEAARLADHEVDQAFAMAFRKAGLERRTLTPEAHALESKVNELRGRVAEDKVRVEQLTQAAATAKTQPVDGDELDVAKAQLALERDELTDASGDLARESGDVRGKLQAELQAHEAAIKKTGEPGADYAIQAVGKNSTLRSQIGAWFGQRTRAKLVQQAQQSAILATHDLASEHDRASRNLAPAVPAGPGMDGADKVRNMQQMGGEKAVMSILDDRIATEAQLAKTYSQWQKQIWIEHRILNHLLLISMAWIALVVLLAAIGRLVAMMLLDRVSADPRRRRTLGTILTLAINLIAGLIILVIFFGPPRQIPTILGLATAGLTVVFQDFILAFFGWFVLMGRNGIRVGDWVEIDGVSGEVEAIGLFRTVLLEAGNWTSRGHPTGRRITSINSFAFRGKYFNFSTHGQWMWDEISVTVPTSVAFDLLDTLQKQLAGTVSSDIEEANRELQRVSGSNVLGKFTAEPTVDLRPALTGAEIVVRFITRASQRFEVRNKLYETMMRILQQKEQQKEQQTAQQTAALQPPPPLV